MKREATLMLRLGMITALVLSLTGCEGDNLRDLRAYVEEVKARRAGPIQPLPEIKQIETFAYVAGDRRNPFSAEQAEEADMSTSTSGIQPDLVRHKEEMEAFPLDSIRMVGTLAQSDLSWGLVQSKDGTIHRVRPGNYMGQNHGQISRVLEDRIELTEIVPDGRGGYVERQASLALNE